MARSRTTRSKGRAAVDAAPRSEDTGSAFPTSIATALGFTGALTLLGALATGKRTAGAAYEALCTWDCGWYQHICAHGYVSAIPPVPQDGNQGNVAFFPGYPLSARVVAAVFALPWERALPFAAQLACVALFTYALLLLRRWRVGTVPSVLAVAAIAAHPAAVYLVMGYSESLLLAGLFGFAYWTSRSDEGPSRAALAAAHGFVVSATRLVGLPLAALPVLRLAVRCAAERRRPTRREVGTALAVSGGATLGGLAFFAWSGLLFGRWNLYMETQRIGWQVVPDYAAVLRPSSYRWGGDINHHALAATALMFVALAGAEVALAARSRASDAARWGDRVALVGVALLAMVISVAGLATKDFNSFVRYALPLGAVGSLAAAGLWTEIAPPPRVARFVGCVVAVALVWALASVGVFDVAVPMLRGAWIA